MTAKKDEKKGAELEVFETQLEPLKVEVLSLKEQAENFEIKTDEDYARAGDMAGVVNEKSKAIEKMRVFFTGPLNAQVKSINGLFNPQIKEAEAIVQIIKGKMAVFFNAEEAKRVAEQKRLEDIRIAADKKRAEEGKEAITTPVREVAMPTRTVATGASKAQVRKVWTHEIEHLDQLPEEIKKAILGEAWQKGIAKSVIQKFVDAGMREISGVRVFEETRIATGNIRQY